MEDEISFILDLIENVRRKKCIYDKMDPFYFNRSVKERTWEDIGESCGKTGTQCKHRWKLMRERFCKELKRIEAPSTSGILEEWKFLQPMMFLKSYLAPRRTSDNIDEKGLGMVSDEAILSEDSLLEPMSPIPPKKSKPNVDRLCKKLGETIKNIELSLATPPAQESADELFMKTVLSLMKELSADAKDEFQANMMQELYRLRRNCRNGQSQ